MSCGLSLLRGSADSFDYSLYVTDGKKIIKVSCHRSVLMTHSAKMRELVNGENFFDVTITVKPGYMCSMMELLQHMYLKNSALLTNRAKILELCAFLRMKPTFINVEHALPPSATIVDLEGLTSHLTLDFQSLLSIKLDQGDVDTGDVTVNKTSVKIDNSNEDNLAKANVHLNELKIAQDVDMKVPEHKQDSKQMLDCKQVAPMTVKRSRIKKPVRYESRLRSCRKSLRSDRLY